MDAALKGAKQLVPGQIFQISIQPSDGADLSSDLEWWYFLGFVYRKDPILHVALELDRVDMDDAANTVLKVHVSDSDTGVHFSTTHQIFHRILLQHTGVDSFHMSAWSEGMYTPAVSGVNGNHFQVPATTQTFVLGKYFSTMPTRAQKQHAPDA